MKNFKKFTAFVLALCIVFSLSVAAFAAEADEHTVYESAPEEEITVQSAEAATSGTIPGSSIKWSLDSKGWLTISGSGEAPVFTSADDQPWSAVREQITEVWFEDVETLTIPDLAYWFEGCVNLTTAELPLAPTIGKHAFYNCPKLSTLTMYYGETVLNSIGEEAFWRENDSGDTLYIGYIIGYPKSSVPFYDYDWAGSNRNNKYFYDLYGIYSDTPAAVGIMSAPGISVTSTGSIIGNCPSCGKYSFQGTYVEVAHSSRGHANYNECNSCHYVQYLGTYTTKSHGSGAYGSGTCPECGSHTWVLQSQRAATCTSNGYRNYSCACGQTKSETIYSSGHSYSYGSWEQYSSSQHRRTGSCRNCGATDYDYASHSMSYGSWSNSSSSQHSRTASCRTCGYSTTEYGNHSYSTGAWSKYSDTQHRRAKTCTSCSASTYDYADHSYSYGSWAKADDTQHKRTKTCSACGDSSEEYANHVDVNGDGKCDDCGATVSLTVTWDAGSNGGTINGKASFSETVKPNSVPAAPSASPVKTGHTFKNWYTEKTGGKLYTTVTAITASQTFYAQFEANKYVVTWNLGDGRSETTEQIYGEKLVLPTEPTRKNAEFLGWFTEKDGGTEVTANTVFKETAATTYYAHWEVTELFSVTVPATLPLVVDETGKVYVAAASIVNNSTGDVMVSSVSVTSKNGWEFVPYSTNMAKAKVDAKQVGFKINSSETSKTGDSEVFTLAAPWTVKEADALSINYDAVVSAVSQPVTGQEIMSVVFVLEWA
ncbi:MAG: InlB B-repeat-containing protein [Oscillospiraceae bacterium]